MTLADSLGPLIARVRTDVTAVKGRGYDMGNVVSCCWDCNRAKGKLSLAAFTAWIDRLVLTRRRRA